MNARADGGHFEALEALLFLDGELAPERALRLAAHAEGCARCSGLLGQLERESRWLQQSLRAPDPSLATAAAGVRRWFWPLVLAGGGVAAGVGVAAMTFLPPLARLAAHGVGGADLLTAAFFDGLFWQRWSAVFGGMQAVVFVALAALALTMLRFRVRRHWRVAAGALLLAALAAGPTAARAAETVHGASYVLPGGQTLHDDLFVVADTVRIDGTVQGDVVAWTRELTVNGRVEGNVVAVSQYLYVRGTITGDLASFADLAEIAGTVGRRFYGFDHHVHVATSGRLGAAAIACETLDLEGGVARDLLAGYRIANLSGAVGGEARLHGHQTSLAASARIGGRLTLHGDQPPTIAPGATLARGWQYVAPRDRPEWRQGSFYWHQALLWAAAFLVGWLLLALLPGFVRRSLSSAGEGHAGTSLGLGVVALVATPIIAILLGITIIGLPLAIILAVVYAIAIYLSEVIVGLWIGRGLLGPMPITASHAWPALAAGLVVERVALNLPYHIGLVVCVAIAIFGLGAQVRALYIGWHREHPAPLPAAVPA